MATPPDPVTAPTLRSHTPEALARGIPAVLPPDMLPGEVMHVWVGGAAETWMILERQYEVLTVNGPLETRYTVQFVPPAHVGEPEITRFRTAQLRKSGWLP